MNMTKRELLKWMEDEIDVGDVDYAVGQIYDKCMEYFIAYILDNPISNVDSRTITRDIQQSVEGLVSEIEFALTGMIINEESLRADLRR